MSFKPTRKKNLKNSSNLRKTVLIFVKEYKIKGKRPYNKYTEIKKFNKTEFFLLFVYIR